MLSSWDNSVVTQLTIEHSHDTRHICDIFHTISPFSFYETARLFKNSSFFEIGAFIIAFKRNINSRIYPTEQYRETDGVIRHLDALIWATLSKRFAFVLYQPCIYLRTLSHEYKIENPLRKQAILKRSRSEIDKKNSVQGHT